MTIVVLIVMLVVTMIFLTISRLAVERLEHTHHGQRADFFEHYPLSEKDVVMLGDSLTAGGCWDELFPGIPVKNRGINADTTTGVLTRMDAILASKPRAIFILIGTNDLPWFEYRHDEDILKTYSEILDRCKAQSPQTRVFVQSILPRHRRHAKRIRGLNARLKELAAQHGYVYIDLHSAFADSQGGLKAELTNDNLHLMANGYALWVQTLTPYMESVSSPSK